MGEVPGAAAVLGAAVLAEGGRRAGGGVGEAVGEAVVGDAGEAVVGVVGESGVDTRGGGVAHRGRLLELDIDTASRGVFDGPFGLVVELIVLQAVAGRSQGGEMGAGVRATHPSDRRTWPRSTRRTMKGGIAWMWRTGEGSACVCVRLRESAEMFLRAKQRNACSERERVRFLTRKGRQKCPLLCQWALTGQATTVARFEVAPRTSGC